jgi:hypothetical protein
MSSINQNDAHAYTAAQDTHKQTQPLQPGFVPRALRRHHSAQIALLDLTNVRPDIILPALFPCIAAERCGDFRVLE